MGSSFCGRGRRVLQSASDVSSVRNAVSKLCQSSKSSSMSLLVSIGDGRSSRLLGFAASSPKLNTSASSFPLPKIVAANSRLSVELGCAKSLMPLHSATASALFTSMLSLHSLSWGCLSEGFATPL